MTRRTGDPRPPHADPGEAHPIHEEGSRRGYDYFLTREQIDRYREKPLELRLALLYQAAVLRRHCPPWIIARQDRFRR